MYWITPDGNYYEGASVAEGSIPVTQRPTKNHVWANGDWVVDNNKVIEDLKNELDEMERQAIMPRGAREAFIALCKQQGQALGLTEPQIYAANPFYRNLKDADTTAAGLRAQITALK